MALMAWILLPAVGLLAAVGTIAVRRSRYLDVIPRYRDALTSLGLCCVEDFLELPSVIVSGHPNRNVARVVLGSGPTALNAFLKREHRVLWRDYACSFLSGFGFVSRSRREARMLAALRNTGIRCPEMIAVGEDGKGRAFVLLRALDSACSLRDLLHQGDGAEPEERAGLVRRLGCELARMHTAGFFHADLYATHVFIEREGDEIVILDWQRSRRHSRLSLRQRARDLAALDATLAEELVSSRERWRCLRAYLREAGVSDQEYGPFLQQIRSQSRRLLRKRHIQELRNAPLPQDEQNLVWLDGEALCVTRGYREELGDVIPRWLLPVPPHSGVRNWVFRQRTPRHQANDHAGHSLGETPHTVLTQRLSWRPWRWLWTRLCGRPFTAPELRQAALLFRLERYGVRVPRLLAFGEHHVRPWWTASFLFMEEPRGTSLVDWMAQQQAKTTFTAERKQVQQMLRQAGKVLRRLHDARCYLAGRLPLTVAEDGSLVLSSVDELRTSRRALPRLARNDLAFLCRSITRDRADGWCILRGYSGTARQDASARTPLQSRSSARGHTAPLRTHT